MSSSEITVCQFLKSCKMEIKMTQITRSKRFRVRLLLIISLLTRRHTLFELIMPCHFKKRCTAAVLSFEKLQVTILNVTAVWCFCIFKKRSLSHTCIQTMHTYTAIIKSPNFIKRLDNSLHTASKEIVETRKKSL